jgi:exodeoxyribonuclease V alpha subunit
MLDLALATRLMEAVLPAARIILLGDKDQLAAVESGAVFSELSADPTLSPACLARLSAATAIPAAGLVPAPPAKPSPLRDCVVWLAENFRFAPDSGIGRLSACVRAGEPAGALQLLRCAADAALEWIEDSEAGLQAASLQRIVAGYSGYVEAARAGATDPAALFEALGRFRVLCAERDGARGVEAVNRLVSQAFRKALEHPLDPGPRSEWYPGRPVMVLRNDYVLKLFNGDVGIVAPDATNALVVHFPDGAGFRPVPPARLPEHETAFAMTVHKAQGSEFEHVLLMLPARASRVLTRELLYTGLTRARSRATIVAGAAELETAIASPTRRYSGLLARLRQVEVRAGSATGA